MERERKMAEKKPKKSNKKPSETKGKCKAACPKSSCYGTCDDKEGHAGMHHCFVCGKWWL